MGNSIADILKDRAPSNEPREFKIIKNFVDQHYKITPTLSVSNNNIVIGVPNAGIAGDLRLSLHELTKACQTDKRLIIRIS